MKTAACALLLLLLLPRLVTLEFLADDYSIGSAIAAAAADHPGPLGAVRDAFTRQWTPDFDVFRPLTILTLQLDWALYGNKAGLHHILNALLWILCALLCAACVRQLVPEDLNSSSTDAVVVLCFGFSPAIVECLGWCVAREDLLCGGCALAALFVQLRWPARLWLRALCVAGAFLAKETAVTVPLLLLWTDLILARPGMDGRAATLRMRLLSAAPSFAVLALALLVRHLLFGQVAGLYSGRTFAAWLGDPELPNRLWAGVSDGLWMLIAPVAESTRDNWVALASSVLLPIICCGGVLFALCSATGRRRLLAFFPWLIAPLILAAVPERRVGSNLEDGRLLLLPLAGLLCILLPSVLTLHRRRALCLGAAALLLVCVWTQQRNLDAFEIASEQVRSLRAEAHEAAPGSGTVLVTGTAPADKSAALIPELVRRDGAFLLSQGFWMFTRPPFDDGPRLQAWSWADGVLGPMPRDVLTAPAITTLVAREGHLHLDLNVPGGPSQFPADLTTTEWDLRSELAPSLLFRPLGFGDVVVHMTAPGETTRAEAAASFVFGEKFAVVPFNAWRIRGGSHDGQPLPVAALRQLTCDEVVVWVEAAATGRLSRPTVLRLRR